MELERRWELDKNNIPINNITKTLHIQQVYSNFNPDVRIRNKKMMRMYSILIQQNILYLLMKGKKLNKILLRNNTLGYLIILIKIQ
jgi:hypothetical protein